MKTKGSVYSAYLDFGGKICDKKCALNMGKYGSTKVSLLANVLIAFRKIK